MSRTFTCRFCCEQVVETNFELCEECNEYLYQEEVIREAEIQREYEELEKELYFD